MLERVYFEARESSFGPSGYSVCRPHLGPAKAEKILESLDAIASIYSEAVEADVDHCGSVEEGYLRCRADGETFLKAAYGSSQNHPAKIRGGVAIDPDNVNDVITEDLRRSVKSCLEEEAPEYLWRAQGPTLTPEERELAQLVEEMMEGPGDPG
jgi:hypothetical protein